MSQGRRGTPTPQYVKLQFFHISVIVGIARGIDPIALQTYEKLSFPNMKQTGFVTNGLQITSVCCLASGVHTRREGFVATATGIAPSRNNWETISTISNPLTTERKKS